MKKYGIEERDKIIFRSYDPDKYMGGVRNFEYMTADTLSWLLEEHYADPEERQNDSPSIQEFFDYVCCHPGFTLHGYAVSDKRPDYRITITGVDSADAEYTYEDVEEFKKKFGNADELETENGLYCWYD